MGDTQESCASAVGHFGERVKHKPHIPSYMGVDALTDGRHDRIDHHECDVVSDDLLLE